MLSISYEYLLQSQAWNEESAKQLLSAFEQQLHDSNIKQIDKQAQSISFNGSAFRWAWNGYHYLNFVSKAQLEYSQRSQIYFLKVRFSYTELILLALAFTIPAVLAIVLQQFMYAAALLFVVWLLFVGGSIWMSRYIFGRWLEKYQTTKVKKKIQLQLDDLAKR